MEEKLLIESKRLTLDRKNVAKYMLVPFVVIYAIIVIYGTIVSIHDGIFDPAFAFQALLVAVIFYLPVLAIFLFVWYISKNQLVVTDKRISGKAAFGKQIDLPIDAVSSVSTIKLIKGLSISTASGNVSFWAIPNRDAIYKVISDLIIARQSKSTVPNAVPQPVNADYTEELKKIKQLLDMGVITQEEFDAKKKQILGL